MRHFRADPLLPVPACARMTREADPSLGRHFLSLVQAYSRPADTSALHPAAAWPRVWDDMTVEVALSVMAAARTGHLAVCDEDGRCTDVVTQGRAHRSTGRFRLHGPDTAARHRRRRRRRREAAGAQPSVVGVTEVPHGPGADVLDRDAGYSPPVSGMPTVPCRMRATWKWRWVGGPSRFPRASKTAENRLSFAEPVSTSATRWRHTASGARRPVMTAPPVTTVRDIWLLCPDSTRAAISTISSSGFTMRPNSMRRPARDDTRGPLRAGSGAGSGPEAASEQAGRIRRRAGPHRPAAGPD